MSCTCCTGLGIETPLAVLNRAGLDTIAYRTGTYATFRASMLAQIGTATAHGLRTRDATDFTIAFLDACAVVADVLTFYDERIANEHYLRTCAELMSVGELARLIGYSPRPGASAAAYLAFRLNDPPVTADAAGIEKSSSALGVTIPAGTKVQSVPLPGQNAQIFETQGDLDARWVANALHPQTLRPYPANSAGIDAIYVPNGAAGHSVGDRLMLSSGPVVLLRTIVAIAIDSASKIAHVWLDNGSAPASAATPVPAAAPAPSTDLTDAVVSALVDGQVWNRDDLETLIARRTWSSDNFEATVNAARTKTPAGTNLVAYSVKAVASLFGHNAQYWGALPYTLTTDYTDSATGISVTAPYAEQWDAFNGVAGDTTLAAYSQTSFNLAGMSIDLDAVYPAAAPGTVVVFVDTATGMIASAAIVTSAVVSRAIYGMSGRVSTITVADVVVAGVASTPSALGALTTRSTAVYIADAQVLLAPLPVTAPVANTSVLLDRCVLPIAAGRFVAISGERSDHLGRTSIEVAEVASVTVEDGFTRLTFAEPLAGSYSAATAAINANVVPGTNGETVAETLGSGNAGVPFPAFKLQQTPLTWISAAVPSGVDAAIEVRVNGLKWKRVPYLYGSAPTDRVYTLLRDRTGATIAQFGDGATYGARLPSGNENVTAKYRRGIGSGGLVAAGAISMLMTRPPGVRDVTNPLASDGAADAETVGQARTNAPFAVKTLDRIVTLEDYGDFVRASAGVAKSRVDLGWSGSARTILLTVAGPGGAAIPDTSTLALNLVQALRSASDGAYPFALRDYRPRSFSINAALAIDPAAITADVQTAVRNALWSAYGFDAQAFGVPVFASSVIATMQGVAGVIAVNLTTFDYTDAAVPALQEHLDAQPAAISGATSVGAELLTIDPIPAQLTVLA